MCCVQTTDKKLTATCLSRNIIILLSNNVPIFFERILPLNDVDSDLLGIILIIGKTRVFFSLFSASLAQFNSPLLY